MSAPPEDDENLLPAVEAAAREAGAVALRHFRAGERTTAQTWSKDGGSPVTAADIAIDRFLRDRLPALVPGLGWLSEEAEIHADSRSAASAWIVDPIDGTRAFISGDATWAVSIGLVRDGRPALACLYLPALDRLFLAAAGRGARCNGARLPPAGPALRLAAGPKPVLERFLAATPSLTGHPKIPSLAARIAMVADGAIAVAIASGGAREWDVAAADLILGEAGGRLTDLSGASLRYDASPRRLGVLMASRETDHDDLARSLGAALAKSGHP